MSVRGIDPQLCFENVSELNISKRNVRATLQEGRYPRSWRKSLGVQDFWCPPP